MEDVPWTSSPRPDPEPAARPPSMTRNVTSVAVSRSTRRSRRRQTNLEGLERREVPKPNVPRGRGEPLLVRISGRRARTVRDVEQGGERGEPDELRFGQVDAVLGRDLRDRFPHQPDRGDREVEEVHR